MPDADDRSARLAQTIRRHRKAAGLSQIALAKLAGVNKKVVFDLEHAKPTVRLATLLRVLDVLNIQVALTSPLEPEAPAADHPDATR